MVEMLTGRPPFTGSNFAQVWSQHLNDKPKGLREQGIDCPEWLEQIIMQLLEKDPERRPFNARAVQGYLKDHLTDEFGPDLSPLTIDKQALPSEPVAPAVVERKPRPDFGGVALAIVLIAILAAAAVYFA
jgi:serine/threonine protein kinase